MVRRVLTWVSCAAGLMLGISWSLQNQYQWLSYLSYLLLLVIAAVMVFLRETQDDAPCPQSDASIDMYHFADGTSQSWCTCGWGTWGRKSRARVEKMTRNHRDLYRHPIGRVLADPVEPIVRPDALSEG